MSHRSHSAEAESNVGSMMESEYELNDDQWGLIFRPALDRNQGLPNRQLFKKRLIHQDMASFAFSARANIRLPARTNKTQLKTGRRWKRSRFRTTLPKRSRLPA